MSAWMRAAQGTFRRPRTARRWHHCATCGTYAIKPGDRHWQCAATPDCDWNGSGRWQRMRECGACAKRYGRPVPAPAALSVYPEGPQ